MVFKLTMIIRECGVNRKICIRKETEQLCDEAQIEEMERLEKIGGSVVSAYVLKERSVYDAI